MSGSDLLKFIF